MGEIKKINIKNQTYYFYNNRIDLQGFYARLLKVDKKDFDERLVDKKDYNETDIYYIGYVTVKKNDNFNNINSVNSLYSMINEMIGHFEEKNENKYFYNDIIDIKTFDLNVLKLDKKSYKDFDIYNIGYVTVKKIAYGYDINRVNP